MYLVRRENWRHHIRRYAVARKALNVWAATVEGSNWASPQELKDTLRNASIVGRGTDRVVFNIKGNEYRLVVRVDYDRQIVDVRWFGTHAEYDRIDVLTV
jgi:mRNA interferase HigB